MTSPSSPRPDVEPLRELLRRAPVRILTARPRGFELVPGERPRPLVQARILGHGAARTLNRDRKPICRSLDGVRPVTDDTATACADCPLRKRCTPQVRLDLLAEQRPLRLLLAGSVARAFLLYEAGLRQRHVAIADIVTTIAVVNRGSWGELRFSARD